MKNGADPVKPVLPCGIHPHTTDLVHAAHAAEPSRRSADQAVPAWPIGAEVRRLGTGFVRQTPYHAQLLEPLVRLPAICPATLRPSLSGGLPAAAEAGPPPSGRLPLRPGVQAPVGRAFSRGRAWW